MQTALKTFLCIALVLPSNLDKPLYIYIITMSMESVENSAHVLVFREYISFYPLPC